MVLRILAWAALLFGAVITAESTLVAHRPNLVWAVIFILGILYFVRNGFLKPKQSSGVSAPPGSAPRQ